MFNDNTFVNPYNRMFSSEEHGIFVIGDTSDEVWKVKFFPRRKTEKKVGKIIRITEWDFPTQTAHTEEGPFKCEVFRFGSLDQVQTENRRFPSMIRLMKAGYLEGDIEKAERVLESLRKLKEAEEDLKKTLQELGAEERESGNLYEDSKSWWKVPGVPMKISF